LSAIREFDASDSVFTLAYAKEVGLISAGLSVKMVRSTIDDADMTAFAADAGVMAGFAGTVNVAAVVQNIGTEVKYSGDDAGKESDELPRNIKLGISCSFLNITTSLDINIPNDNRANASAGIEYIKSFGLLDIPLRIGYRTLNDFDCIDGLSAGCGVVFRDINADFAWIPFGELGDTFRVSLIFGF